MDLFYEVEEMRKLFPLFLFSLSSSSQASFTLFFYFFWVVEKVLKLFFNIKMIVIAILLNSVIKR